MLIAEAHPIHRELAQAAARLPTSARIFERINEALVKPDVDIAEITDIISQDSSIALRVLRLANSVQFVRGEPFESLQQAVDWVGITHIYRLLAATVSSRLFCDNLPHYGLTSEQLWRNAVATGTAMHLIAEGACQDQRRAYTLGLFRPVGRLVLQQLAIHKRLPMPAERMLKNRTFLAWEKSSFGVNNAEAVAHLFKVWGLQPSLGEAIGHHYDPLEAAGSSQAPSAALLHIAGWMVREAGYGLTVESDAWNPEPAILELAGLPKFNLQPQVKHVKEITERLTVVPSRN